MYGGAVIARATHYYKLRGEATDFAYGVKNNGSLVGTSITYVSDKNGNANSSVKVGKYSSTWKYFELPDVDTLSVGNGTNDKPYSFNVDMYVIDVAGANWWWLNKDDGTTNREYQFTIQTSALPGKGGFGFYRRDHSAAKTIGSYNTSTGDSMADNTWTNVSFVTDGAGGATAPNNDRIYKNGISLALTHITEALYVASENTTRTVRTGRTDASSGDQSGALNNLSFFENYMLDDYESSILKSRY